MKSALAAALLAAVFTAPSCDCGTGNAVHRDSSSVATSADQLFSPDHLPSFHLTLAPRAVASLDKQPRDFVEGTFSYQGNVYERVAVRLKGHRAMQKFDGKPAFKINFAKHDKGRRFLGLKRLTLNNLVEDPTMMREVLGYRMFREAGVPAPRAGYALVYVNGEYYGVYANVESVDKTFVRARFDDASGSMYEGEYGCDLYPDDVSGFEQDAGKDESREDLAAFAAAPLESIDRDNVLGFLAVSALIGDFDGYRHSHNYRIYRDPTSGKWSFIPWGLDRTFKKHLDPYDSGGLVAVLCFADAECRRDYAIALRAAADRLEAARLDLAMDRLGDLTDRSLVYDPRKPYNLHATRTARAAMRAFVAERPAEIRKQVTCVAGGREVDADGDGYGCMDCNDADATVHPGAAEVCGDAVDNDCSTRADDAPACGCPTAEIDGATFLLCEFPMTWWEAEAHCEAQSATLARIDSADQARAVIRAARKHGKGKWWIGLNDRSAEAAFVWADGAPVSYTAWSRGEPDNDACNQDCAAFRDDETGEWHDTHCGSRLAFVCRAK